MLVAALSGQYYKDTSWLSEMRLTPMRAQVVDTTRFDEMYQRCAASVIRYLRRRVHRDDVEDLAAEVFTVAWTKLTAVNAGEELPWLYRIAQLHVANHRRKQRAIPFADHFTSSDGQNVNAIDTDFEAESGDPTATAALAKLSVIQALDTLSDEDRELLLLIAWEGCTGDELAKVLNCEPSTARKRLMRARNRFSAALN
jgi:RNA polymerase sigma factor (sigma-70 family)